MTPELLKKLVKNCVDELCYRQSKSRCDDFFDDDKILKGITTEELEYLGEYYKKISANNSEDDFLPEWIMEDFSGNIEEMGKETLLKVIQKELEKL